MKVTICLILLVLPLYVYGSFWDSLAVISQLKSLVQVIAGDADGARRTQENFIKTNPLFAISQTNYHMATGDLGKAKKTLSNFKEHWEPVVDGTPVVGHIKGTIHSIAGDTERGKEIINNANANTLVVAGAAVGCAVGGPVGCFIGSQAGQYTGDGIKSAISGKPQGVIDYWANVKRKSTGDHIDMAFDAISDAVPKPQSKSKILNVLIDTSTV